MQQLQGDDPFKVLAGIYSMDIQELARLVRSKANAQAVALKIRAAEIAMPYVHSKMPVKVQVDDERLPTLVIIRNEHQLKQFQGLMKDVTPRAGQDGAAPDAQPIDDTGENGNGPADRE